jgi:glyoxylase-like metal-dependent hydrolase (beta-lactamase superfamily II)
MKRRQLLKSVGVLGILTSLSPYQLNARTAQGSLRANSPAGYIKYNLGSLELLVVTDGHILVHPAQPIFAPDIDTKRVKQALADNFIQDDAVDAAINVLVIKHEKRIIIIDTGSGSLIGEQAGRFMKNLNAAGIAADNVTDVFLTHLHVDHIGGIMDGNGDLAFKNAAYYLAAKEYSFWMSKHPDFSHSKNKSSNEGSVLLARNIILAIKQKLNLYNFGETLFGCITAESAEGHTPGHPVLKIFSGNKSLTHIVDTVHTTLLLSHPEWGTEWDIDFDKGVTTRRKLLEEQVVSKGLTMSCHLPWPGLGYVVKKGDGYGWSPIPISTPYL